MTNLNSEKLSIIHIEGSRIAQEEYISLTEKDYGITLKYYLTYLCNEQSKLKNKLIGILFSKDGKSLVIERRDRYILLFLPTTFQLPFRLKKIYKNPINPTLFSNIIKMKPQIVNLHGLFTYYLSYLFLIPLLKIKKIKIFSFIRGQDPIFSFIKTQEKVKTVQKFLYLFLYIIQFILCKFSDVIICQNKRVGYLLQKYKLSKKNKIRFVPNGVDLKLFTPMKREFCLKKLNLDPDCRYILMVNRINFHQKDILTVLESLKDLFLMNEKIKIIIIGDGPDLPKLEKFIKENNLLNKVIHLKFVHYNKMPLYYNSADCFILHSKFEGMPKVILESFACKTPVISSDLHSTRFLVKPKKTGILVEFQNRNQIIEAVKMIFSDENQRTNMINNAYNFIQNFSWRRISNYLIKLYKKALRK
ncbi:MAG: glycosyltransferase family 4 protein [Candidatus Hodarchaeota archaeon]